MQGAYTQYCKAKGYNATGAVEQECALRKEEATLRLAKIHNGKDPKYKNGNGKGAAMKNLKTK